MSKPNKPIKIFCITDHGLLRTAIQCMIDANSNFLFIGGAEASQEGLKYLDDIKDSIDLILVYQDRNVLQLIGEIRSICSAKVAVIPHSYDTDYLDGLVVSGVHGLFMPEADFNQFCKAINTIYDGELWLDRQTTSRLIKVVNGNKEGLRTESDGYPSMYQINELLTAREREVFLAIGAGEGKPLEAIAQDLFISHFTLRNHLTSIYNKLGLSSRLQLYVCSKKAQINR